MFTPQHCQIFDLPFFQFAQLKKYQPESIEQIKANHKNAWQDWKTLIEQVATDLGEPFAAPHIERWCNGWQVRAHFFAYFKYAQYQDSAAILSILLNRKRLTVSLDWHCYKAGISPIALPQFNQWLDDLDKTKFADFDVWHGDESEYADYQTLAQTGNLVLRSDDDFWSIGKHIAREDLAHHDCRQWIIEQIRALQPLYELCFK